MNNVLLIYQYIPERTVIYNLNLDDERFAWLKQCHGVYQNCSEVAENHPIHELDDWVTKLKVEPIYDDEVPDGRNPINLDAGYTVIVTGFVV